ncbi:LmeA family phospholipid-binding protein [Naasia lichenicola]|uniref:DUF2993 domain-containing protein n=1 Tax=Naasia lichenicola TaxID=2565933 RepID=A0A4S4FMU5_9MICO|nr:LmeA family phospholipid-binding protein [Naasia lichenicola]THG31504.1 hypothetical protein E6C64_05340 [Naasia lichenicola]
MPSTERRLHRGRRIVLGITIPIVILALLGFGAFLVGDPIARTATEKGISDGIEQQLPPEVEGTVVTEVGGGSMIRQFIAGTIDEISLDSDQLTVSGAPATVHVDLRNVPTDYQNKPTESAAGNLRFTDSAAAQLLAQQGVRGVISFGNGIVNYSDSATVLGQDLPFTVVLQPALENGVVSFTPTAASVEIGGIDIDASRLIDVVAPEGLSICVAQYLPSALQLNRVTISEHQAVVGFSAHDITFSEQTMASTGSCS